MAVLWNPHADRRDYLSIIEGDPGLTASVLRATNSFSAGGTTLTAAQAVEQLGVDAAAQIVRAAFARAEFEDLARSDLHLEDFWTWQLAVGLLTECFCLFDQRPPNEIEAAFTAGLIHQVGRLALIAHGPERYREVVNLVNTGVDPLEAEWQLLGDDATHLSNQVATHWRLFEPLPSALSAFSKPEAQGLPRLLREAREVAALLGFDEGYSLQVPVPTALPPEHPRSAALAAIGGLEGLRQQIEWFRQASGGRTPLTLDRTDPADRLAS